MLVLMRREDQRVVINPGCPDEVVITVVEIQGRAGKVRLGFSAREEVIIHRHEVAEAIRRDAGEGRA